MEDSLDFHMLDIDGLSTSAIEDSGGDATLGRFPHINKLPSVVIGTLGDGNKTEIYLTFIK